MTTAFQVTEERAAFSVVFLGVGGGPLENNSSCYLMKPTDSRWEDNTLLVEGGSFLGSLDSLLRDAGQPGSVFHDVTFDPSINEEARAGKFNENIQSVLISHGHLDHIFGLVLASAVQCKQRPVYGTEETLKSILNVFDGRIWPPLASFDATDPLALYHLRRLICKEPVTVAPSVQVTPFLVTHGKSIIPAENKATSMCGDNPILRDKSVEDMHSTAFLITNMHIDRHILFFGDVESDVTGNTATNHDVWVHVAPLFSQKRLRTVFIECSFSDAQPRELLFGHFTPALLYHDLRDFARCVAAYNKSGKTEGVSVGDEELVGVLSGLNCIIIHIKGMVNCHPAAMKDEGSCSKHHAASQGTKIIGEQIAQHEAEGRLGVNFHISKRGERLEC